MVVSKHMQAERRGPRTVLIVDDDPAMRAVLRDSLQRDGYRVVEAEDGAAALLLVESEPVDVAIVDKEMPGTKGLDLLSFLHARCPAMPVIFITAFGGTQVAEESRRRGAVQYLEKPFRIRSIVETVQTIIPNHR